jgi:hypothetical protein
VYLIAVCLFLAYQNRELINMPLPDAPKPLSANMVLLLKQFAIAWAKSPDRPRISQEIQAKWDRRIEEWIEADDIPLLVRKGSDRGAVHENSGRKFIVTDNSPAQWAFFLACDHEPPTLGDIRNSLCRAEDGSSKSQEIIPISFALSKTHLIDPSRYKMVLSKKTDVNSKGWKLAHIDNVGLNQKKPISALSIDLLEDHFRKLMAPSNMFVIPKCWAGVAEAPEVLDVMKFEIYNIQVS